MASQHSELSDMLTKNISEVVVYFRSDEDGMKRYEEFTADQFRSLFEQLEARERLVNEVRFYFEQLRTEGVALTIGMEQALDALNPAKERP